MQQLPRCAGTLPINLIDDPVRITGRNDGAFWFQSAVTISAIRDGTSSTAAFSERCLGNSIQPDPLGDVYEVSPTLAACAGKPGHNASLCAFPGMVGAAVV